MCENLPAVQGNATALSQVLDGLIANGLEAMPDGGRLILSSELTADGADVLVTVEDNGVGIAENEVEQVFRPYATTKSAGLGLGLPVARRLVERHGGTLVLSSRPGDGTIVTMRIPVSQ